MQPESILKADVLEIIFENRNKKYGAYYLRKHYKQYMLRSMGISAVLVAILLFLITRNGREKSHLGTFTIADPHLTPVDPFNLKIPESPKSPRHPNPVVATTEYFIPRIVQQPEPTDPPMPDMSAIGDKQISTSSSQGGPGDFTQGPENTNGQNLGTTSGSDVKHDGPMTAGMVDEQAEYPGGMASLQKYLQRNLHDPRDGDQESGTARVNVRFVVEEDGSITRFEILSSGGEIVDQEVLRVLHKMPKWKPAKKNGKYVAMYFVQPVLFAVSGD